jgi:hypothetical protein
MNKTLTKNVMMAAIATTALSLGACGETRGDRTLSGAGIGAGAGALGTAVLGGNPVTGALIGGAVGAGTGYVTRPRDIDLGEPWWR